MDCVYCEDADIRARIFAENEYAFAFPTNIPITPGHTLVVPKRHVATVFELKSGEVTAIISLASQVQHALKRAFKVGGFNMAFNQGEAAGQSIPHFHLHIVPRIEGDAGIHQYEPREFLYRPGSRAKSPETELKEISNLLRSMLQ